MPSLQLFGSMKKLSLLVLIMVVGLLVSGISDTKASIADISIPDDEVTGSISEGNNSSANAAITMWTVPDE